MMKRRPGAGVPARWVSGVLVGVLAVATIIAAVVALDRVRPAEPTSEALPVPTFTPAPQRATTPTATTPPATPTTPPGSRAAAGWPHAAERFLSIGTEAWWRATAGECGGAGPVIERSADAGRTWSDVTPRYRGIAQVLSLDAFAGSQAQAVAAMGAECDVQALRTFTQGQFWESYPEVLAASRYALPRDPGQVVTPAGTVPAPCANARGLRAAGDTIALVCDGTAYRFSGTSWAPLPVADAVAVAATAQAVLVGAAASGCDGVLVSRVAGDQVEPLGCAVGADPAQPIALASSGSTVTVWSGDALIPVPTTP